MEIRATLKYMRIAPRKMRLVTQLVNGMDYVVVKSELSYRTKKSAHPLMKLIDSAAQSAYNNYGLVKENLFIKSITVDGGPTLKRYKPKGFGSAMPIGKRTSHVTVILDEKVPGLKATETKKGKKDDVTSTATEMDVIKDDDTQEKDAKEKGDGMVSQTKNKVGKGDKKKGREGSFMKRMFRRKSI